MMYNEDETKYENSLAIALGKIFDKESFSEFDTFLIQKMLPASRKGNITMEERSKAYKLFYEQLNGETILSERTMKKWFGIGGRAVPKREQIYEICFALKLDEKEAEEYLTAGIHEPSFQINDYQETIFLYGLEHGLTYGECTDMIHSFELNMDESVIFSQTHSTHELRRQFAVKRNLPTDRFLQWMLDNASFFKGYSKTSLDYLEQYKRIIVKIVRDDAEVCLDDMLEETNFYAWKKSMPIRRGNKCELVRKYIYRDRKLPEELRKSILKLLQIVYAEVDQNTVLLTEVFSYINEESVGKGEHSRNLKRLTNKHLSDLLNVAIQKERDIRTSQARSALENMEDNENCPLWIVEIIGNYSLNKKKVRKVKEAKVWIAQYQKEHKRRCLLVQRSDLLPFILYVAQHRYMESTDYLTENYIAEKAERMFEEMANVTLTDCNMALLSNDYEMDTLLRNCYQPDEMYSYSDMMEVIRHMEEN